MIAAVGSNVKSFRIIRDQLATSYHLSLHLLLEIQIYQKVSVSYCWVLRTAVLWSRISQLPVVVALGTPRSLSVWACRPQDAIEGRLEYSLLNKTHWGHVDR